MEDPVVAEVATKKKAEKVGLVASNTVVKCKREQSKWRPDSRNSGFLFINYLFFIFVFI